jgi:Na+-transporting methylmalonyl-CoA/oxaloacetate decarboxylase gamma subunit
MDAGVISAAAASPLGILALLVLVMSGLATAFFRDAGVRVRVLVFLIMLAAVVLFGGAVLRQGHTPDAPRPQPAPQPGPQPIAGPQTPAAGDQILPHSSERPVAAAELAPLSPAALRIARNEIYARRGYIFKAADLREHFAAFGWYRPEHAAVTLTPVEAQNVAALTEAERLARSPN